VDPAAVLVAIGVVRVAGEVVISLAVADRRRGLAIELIKAIVRRVVDHPAERNCSVPGDASAGLLNVILAEIPDHRRADVDRPPDAALLKGRRVAEADDPHDLAPRLVPAWITRLRY